MSQRIAIIGGGLTGLTAAYRLNRTGNRTVIFEKENRLGGLAAGFKKPGWDWSLEDYYHHFFTSDNEAKKLIGEVGLTEKLFFQRPRTAIYQKGAIAQFDSPMTVLAYPHLSLAEKIRVGGVTAFLKATNNWQDLEKATAKEWLIKYYGKRAFAILWEPLLRSKYAENWQEISMAWFWARIKKRSTQLGYLEGGFEVLIDRLAELITKKEGRICLNHEVKSLKELKDFDKVLITTPAENFLKLKMPPMVGVITLILTIKEQFFRDNTYWLSINEHGFPFLAVVEHTNFIDPKHYGGERILYVGEYYPQKHRFFREDKEKILAEFAPFLKKINSDFDLKTGITDIRMTKNLYAQPTVPVNYSKIVPKFKTDITNVFLANMQMVYPWDRGTNYAIEMGEKAAYEISRS
jgi:protoporphyrinogen oxidase